MEPDLVPYTATTKISARSVLVLAPHADDEVFGCGGAIRHHVINEVPVSVIILTDGALYGDANLREDESRAAALLLGYGMPEFWGIPDRGVQCCEDLVVRVVNKIKATDADLVYAPSPWEIHPDHRQTAQVAIEAIARLDGPVRVIFYEVGAPLRPNVLLDISATAATKDQAMACFESQLKQQDYSKHIRSLNQYRTYTLAKSVTAAEGFLLLSAADLVPIVQTGFFDQISVGIPPTAESFWANGRAAIKWPLVTILVNSDDGDSLISALDSIAVQTYPNINVTVVARRSSHKKLPLRCGRFPLEVLPTDSNISRSVAVNRALCAARGAYVVILDAADWLMPGHIAKLVNLMSSNPAVIAAHSGVRWVGAHGQPLDRTIDTTLDVNGKINGIQLPLSALMVSSVLLRSGCRFDTTLTDGGDASFLAAICDQTVPAHSPGLSAICRADTALTTPSLEVRVIPRPQQWLSRVLDTFR